MGGRRAVLVKVGSSCNNDGVFACLIFPKKRNIKPQFSSQQNVFIFATVVAREF